MPVFYYTESQFIFEGNLGCALLLFILLMAIIGQFVIMSYLYKKLEEREAQNNANSKNKRTVKESKCETELLKWINKWENKENLLPILTTSILAIEMLNHLKKEGTPLYKMEGKKNANSKTKNNHTKHN